MVESDVIEREIYIDASPEIVFEVVSHPDHVQQWWPDEAHYEPVPGSTGEIVFGPRDSDGTVVPFTVVDAQPPRTFAFRWTQPAGEAATPNNSLLVSFDLTPSGGGTILKMTESGFRQLGLGAAAAEEQYEDHVVGWDYYMPRLVTYVATLEVRS